MSCVIILPSSDYLDKLYRTMPPLDENDIAGAAAAIGRLMDVYELDASDVANGKLLQIGMHEPLSGKEWPIF